MTDDELNDLSYSAYEEAMGFGMSRDVFMRYFRTIRDRAAAPQAVPTAIELRQQVQDFQSAHPGILTPLDYWAGALEFCRANAPKEAA